MPEYKKLYLDLFNSVTDTIELLEQGRTVPATKCLIDAQRDAEAQYIAADDRTDQERARTAIAQLCEDLTRCEDPEISEALANALWCALRLGFEQLLPILNAHQHQAAVAGDGSPGAYPPGTD
jgi:hypothetical protein